MGIMQALISIFLDDGDKLRCINAGNTRINALIRSPLYYVCVSSWGEPESVVSFKLSVRCVFLSHLRSKTRSHLEYLHLQVLSVVTVTQLRRIFERRTNFDLGRLLSGTLGGISPSFSKTHFLKGSEILIHSLLDRVENDMSMGTSSLHCLKLDPVLRSRAANHLIPTSKMKVRTEY
jgi:hypothetical protein